MNVGQSSRERVNLVTIMSESTMPDNIGRQKGIDEAGRLASDYLLKTWLIIDRVLPQELLPIRDGLKWRRTRHSKGIGLATNFIVFICAAGYLHRDGNMTMGDLSQALSIPRSTATRMIDWMVDNGYVDRFQDGKDGRRVHVRLTDRGLEFLLAAKAQLSELAGKFIERLPAIQRAAVIFILTDLVSAWQSAQEERIASAHS
jgi:DNA-binding MarR family transcriptional regulator